MGKKTFLPGFIHPALPRRRLNDLASALAVVLPCAFFTTVLYLLSFEVHYYHPKQCLFIVGCLFLVVVCLLWKAAAVARRQARLAKIGDLAADGEPTWFRFLAATTFAAWLLAVVLGTYNYSTSTVRVNFINDMTIVGVAAPMANGLDPSVSHGKAYLDASVIRFVEGSVPDKTLSLSYKEGTTYCVAPVRVGNISASSYDFWAVGTECCNPYGGSFWCGAAEVPGARVGSRLMDVAQRPFYELAVQQACAQWNIQAQNPLFFEWTIGTDAGSSHAAAKSAAASGYAAAGWRFFYTATVGFFIVQCILVWVVLNHYAKFLDPVH